MEALALEAVEVGLVGGGSILGPVNLTVNAGERWALLGPNGSGKTTLLSVAGARRHPTRGAVRILGEPLGRSDVRILRGRIGHVGTAVGERLGMRISARDAVMTGRYGGSAIWGHRFTDGDRGRADGLLDEVGCTHVADRPIGTCSQGERARVLIARARFGRHELVLLDEPAAGLDLPGRELLLMAMEGMARSEDALTMAMATHHLEEIPPSTTHAALLRAGELVAAGAIGDVLTGRHLTDCFGLPVRVTWRDGRWSATAG